MLAHLSLNTCPCPQGPFAFCIWDSVNKHAWAARDAEGEPASQRAHSAIKLSQMPARCPSSLPPAQAEEGQPSPLHHSLTRLVDTSAPRGPPAPSRPAGAQPLFWGTTADGQLVFSTSAALLEECDPSASPFPAGSLYASAGTALAVSPGEEGW